MASYAEYTIFICPAVVDGNRVTWVQIELYSQFRVPLPNRFCSDKLHSINYNQNRIEYSNKSIVCYLCIDPISFKPNGLKSDPKYLCQYQLKSIYREIYVWIRSIYQFCEWHNVNLISFLIKLRPRLRSTRFNLNLTCDFSQTMPSPSMRVWICIRIVPQSIHPTSISRCCHGYAKHTSVFQFNKL